MTVVIPWWTEVETDFLHDQLISALVRTGAVDVVERTRLDAILDEQDLARKEFTDPAEAARLGRLLGADYIVLGTLAGASRDKKGTGVPHLRESDLRLAAEISIDYRVVETETSRVVASDREWTREESRYLGNANDPAKEEFDALWQEARGAVVSHLARRVVDALVPLEVVAVRGGEVELSRGAAAGVLAGERYDVYDDRAPEGEATPVGAVGRPRRVGQVEIVRAGEFDSTAAVLDENESLRAGAVCRRVAAAPPPPVEVVGDPLEDRW